SFTGKKKMAGSAICRSIQTTGRRVRLWKTSKSTSRICTRTSPAVRSLVFAGSGSWRSREASGSGEGHRKDGLCPDSAWGQARLVPQSDNGCFPARSTPSRDQRPLGASHHSDARQGGSVKQGAVTSRGTAIGGRSCCGKPARSARHRPSGISRLVAGDAAESPVSEVLQLARLAGRLDGTRGSTGSSPDLLVQAGAGLVPRTGRFGRGYERSVCTYGPLACTCGLSVCSRESSICTDEPPVRSYGLLVRPYGPPG